MDYDFIGAQSGAMETFESLVRSEFAPKSTYLNTASTGLMPARTVAAMQAAVEASAAGRPTDMFADVEAARASFARLTGCPAAGWRRGPRSPSTPA